MGKILGIITPKSPTHYFNVTTGWWACTRQKQWYTTCICRIHYRY